MILASEGRMIKRLEAKFARLGAVGHSSLPSLLSLQRAQKGKSSV
jgi:hypothetical protein